MPFFKTALMICLLCLMSSRLALAVDDNPFTNAGGDGSIVETPLPAPSVTTADPQSPASTPLPMPEAKPDILVRMSRADCRRLLRRQNVASADYVPGVDVRGNAVESADLTGTLTPADVLPDEIAFELALNPLSYAGNTALADVFSNSASAFGMVTYDLASGALTFNGTRLDPATEDGLLTLCQQALQGE